jgi:ABC-type nitrate/sulfonate/bicarbonate transport system substrate-binding protein
MNIKAHLQLLFLALCCVLAPIRAGAQISNVRIAFNGFGGIAPLYLGQDVGIFKKHGLNLEMIFIPGGSLSLQALIGKSLDLLMTGGPPVVNAYLQGAKIKIIGGATNLLPYMFVATGGIRSAEQLKGKRIGISRFGSNTDYVVRLALNQFALSPNEVQIIQVGGSQARLVAMKSGAIQATVLSPEETLVAQKMGYGILLDFIEKGIEFPHVKVVVRDDFLETQPQTVRSFMRVYIHARLHRIGALLQNTSRGSDQQDRLSEQTPRSADGRRGVRRLATGDARRSQADAERNGSGSRYDR